MEVSDDEADSSYIEEESSEEENSEEGDSDEEEESDEGIVCVEYPWHDMQFWYNQITFTTQVYYAAWFFFTTGLCYILIYCVFITFVEVPKLKPIKFSMDTSSETSPEKCK